MSDQPFVIVQDIYKTPHPAILVTTIPLASLTQRILQDFLGDGVIGVAPAYGTDSVLLVLAFATASKVLLVRLAKRKGKAKAKQHSGPGRNFLEDLLLSAYYAKFAFEMDVLATSLHFDFGLRITSAVDLLSISKMHDRHSLQAIMTSLGGELLCNKPRVSSLFKGKATLPEVALQAWVAWRAATLVNITSSLNKVPRIDTNLFDETRLTVFAKMVRNARRLSALKPTVVKNEIAKDWSTKKGRLHLTCTRFKTRVQQDSRVVEIQVTHEGKQKSISSRPTKVDGRAVRLNLDTPLPPGAITRVTTIGKEPPTCAEAQQTEIILNALQKTSAIADKAFFQAIWLPQEKPTWSTPAPFARAVPLHFPSRSLNGSQQRAVAAILSNHRITVIHGPPGTGKTTVIAAVVASISASSARDQTIWLIAQSNVAVKNIAEKLASVDFLDFKLIVSKDFHYDWHEHLYEKINPNLIRSDMLTDDIVATARQIMGSKVILCTLSMLSNRRVSTVTRIVPLQTVIVDEASQVQIGDYTPMISLFSTTLRKLVFIGDDKQLAPYGQGDVPALQSIFELKHLRQNAVFLDTQYRMPTQLGTFIGKRVYSNKLKTVHPDNSQCCRFIDVAGSKEVSNGSSWINEAEVRAAIREAKECVNKGRSYRIITPYDAQRGRIEAALKSEEIPWEDRVFCVDSFQGNEADYIILSIVRTKKIGFLAEQRRVNVMLTRCKKRLTICTNRAFVEGAAKDTLVGLLAKDIGAGAWEN